MTIFRPIYSLQQSGITYFRVQRRFLLMQLPSLVPAFKAHFVFRICRQLLVTTKKTARSMTVMWKNTFAISAVNFIRRTPLILKVLKQTANILNHIHLLMSGHKSSPKCKKWITRNNTHACVTQKLVTTHTAIFFLMCSNFWKLFLIFQ